MYKILTNKNEVLGYVEKPNYIKIAENGDVIPSLPVNAVGLNFQGTLYNLLGHNDIEGASTAYVSMISDAEFNAMIKDSQQQTTDLQLAIIELYESTMKES